MEITMDSKELKPIIDLQIQKTIMEALGKDPDALIKTVVKQAMETKSTNYPYKSLFAESVDSIIREAAIIAFKAWLDTKKDTIKNAIIMRLRKEESKFFEDVADQLVNGLSKSFYVSVNLKVEND